jgi:hypothetical protein
MLLSWPLLHRWVTLYDEGVVPYGKRCQRRGKEIEIGDKSVQPFSGT